MESSLFLVGEIGANDYNHPFSRNKTLEWVRPLVPQVISSIALSIKALIELGAKTVVRQGNGAGGVLSWAGGGAVPGPVEARVVRRPAHDGGGVQAHGPWDARRPVRRAAHHVYMQPRR
ncbi:hypothetical protein TRIUR3_03925 [Triticum urartu]|uniref:GDSL esterase/lipase n=1 Tax=Triticum urartu TaxID=4572 RepID=M8AL70_TRIUA|nr:hypothetical protein TRIUR3_03925 [Triticum urartu]